MYIGGIAGPLVLIVIGAIMRWAVDVEVEGFDIQLAGLIILIVGIIGLVASLIFWFSRRGAGGPPPTDGVVYHDAPSEQVIHERVVREEAPPERVVRERTIREDPYDHV